uniref:Uncharacterized protein n=1 Tax=viral metagenome TaxID=1070528 RepID=A0A6C0DR46_9ZZZZ
MAVLVVVGLPVIVDELRAVVVVRGDEEEVFDVPVDRVEVIEAVTVLVEVVVGVICPVPIGENE